MAQGAAVRPPRQHQHRRGLSFARPPADRDHKQRVEGEATVAYIKRILCARTPDPSTSAAGSTARNRVSEPLEQLLPPLTSSNDVDIQLYALIAVVLNLFVQTWYNRITPDQEFIASIVQIIAHCTRALEQRLRHVDVERLLLDELPELLTEHVDAVRIAQTALRARFTTAEVRHRYHALRPHPALSPVPVDAETTREQQQENEAAWCLLLVDRVLPLLLPPEDLQNPCLDVLVSEILAELIFHNGICGKACEPWLLWDGITKLLRAMRSSDTAHKTPQNKGPHTNSSSQREALELLTAAPASNASHEQLRPRRRFEVITHTFWTVIQAVMTIWLLVRTFTLAMMQASSIPARPVRSSPTSDGLIGASDEPQPTPKEGQSARLDGETRPIIGMHVWECTSKLLMLEQRTPWLSGMLSLLQWTGLHGPGQVCSTNSRLDRLLSFQLHARVLNNANKWLPSILQATRNALFPENVPAPARVPPTADETVQMRQECAAVIVDAVPDVVRARFFATGHVEVMRQDVEMELDVLLGDVYLNKHLVVRVVELVVARLFPELQTSLAGQ
ncbi:hypothetical protein CERZMDRAFT_66179 [Cercospora zeae-maydis SCOH1-5]|uniref:PXA domain-containing protein n=1 Tax=Cercospora zeae-maydis SCOH1-5 TaxID=717836 RepID=A0A6A6FNQ3_9PEZI|nr:hypothetical protein CERZMDRAFT_66179 [Cercospora zeae-maydis SCOH1-5]